MKNFCLALAVFAGIVNLCLGQSKVQPVNSRWKMQYTPIVTRWAKKIKPASVLIEYPRPQMMRKNWQNLNGLWKYAITKENVKPPTSFDGEILVPFPLESALSGIKGELLPDQNLWYSREFNTTPLHKEERLLLHFGAIDWMATVYVNGSAVGSHSGGYQHFTFDITNYLKNGNNNLVVQVYDPTDRGPNPHGKQTLHPQSIYYTPSSGIWQTVWLEKVPTAHILNLVSTPDIDKGILYVSVSAENADSMRVELTAEMKGEMVGQIIGRPGETLELPVPNPRLWSPDNPFLYDLTVKLKDGQKIVDMVNSYFGMRKIAIQKDEKGANRIFLNNKYTYNLGVLDQGFWPDGLYTAPTDEALAFDIKAVKAMGFNAIRKHIKIEPDRWYYHADKEGVLVWQDFVNPPHQLPEEAKRIFEQEVKETMSQLHNHPCVVTWVLFNEQWGAYDQKRLTAWVKATDPSRIVDGHTGEYIYINGKMTKEGHDNWVNSDMTDVHSYPDPMLPPTKDSMACVVGEFGGVGVAVQGHEWTDLKGWGYIEVAPAELVEKYAGMTKQLKQLEAQGLSASIYTEPFDVEGEENGLLTYDREIIKIPLTRIRQINEGLVPQTEGFKLDHNFKIARNVDVNDTDDKYDTFLAQYDKGLLDSAFLRRLTLMAIRKRDQRRATQIGKDYIRLLKEPLLKDNLLYLRHITRTSMDAGFTYFCLQTAQIDSVLGLGVAEKEVGDIIYEEEIAPFINTKKANPNWDSIQAEVTRKYGAIGEEFILGQRMFYYWRTNHDWVNLGKYYVLYYKRALKYGGIYNINNVSWDVFIHVNDPEVLKFAVTVSKYNMENLDWTPEAIDTYANLLYKIGETGEAIRWESKVVDMSKEGKDYVETLSKMKNGRATWPKE